MPRRRKHAQYSASGCKICGDGNVGRGIAQHVKGAHGVDYNAYQACYGSGKVLVNRLEESGTTDGGKKRVVIHVLVRRLTVPV
jgi:hypothetical protein